VMIDWSGWGRRDCAADWMEGGGAKGSFRLAAECGAAWDE